MALKRLAGMAVVISMILGPGGLRTSATADANVIVVSGTLDGEFLAGALFHIGEFWMRVPPDTAFHRWFSQGMNRKVVITLTTDPARFGDAGNVRILSGTLMHGTAPQTTPATTDVVGRLPAGNSPVVHILFLKDELTGSFGAVTFETADLEVAAKFTPYDGTHINLVIQIE